MTLPCQEEEPEEEREPDDEHKDHRAKHLPIYRDFDEAAALKDRKRPRIRRFRRGPVVIRFPLKPERLLTLLTGRKTVRKAIESFRAFLDAFEKAQMLPSYVHEPWTTKGTRDFVFSIEWTQAKFVKWAESYVTYPRKGFNIAKGQERIFQIFLRLNANSSPLISGQQTKRARLKKH